MELLEMVYLESLWALLRTALTDTDEHPAVLFTNKNDSASTERSFSRRNYLIHPEGHTIQFGKLLQGFTGDKMTVMQTG